MPCKTSCLVVVVAPPNCLVDCLWRREKNTVKPRERVYTHPQTCMAACAVGVVVLAWVTGGVGESSDSRGTDGWVDGWGYLRLVGLYAMSKRSHDDTERYPVWLL